MRRPVRLQLSRQRGFNLHVHSRAINGLPALFVARPSQWGNPFRVKSHDRRLIAIAVHRYTHRLDRDIARWTSMREALNEEVRGRNLACWCRLCPKHKATGKPFDEPCSDCAPCHADILGARANGFVCEDLATP